MPYDVVGKTENPTINLDEWGPVDLSAVSNSDDWHDLDTILNSLPPCPQANPSFRGSGGRETLHSNVIVELGDDSVDRISTQIMDKYQSQVYGVVARHDFSMLSSVLILYVMFIIIVACVRRTCCPRHRENTGVVLPSPQSVGGARVLEANPTSKKEVVYL